jgi:hypothetical protein
VSQTIFRVAHRTRYTVIDNRVLVNEFARRSPLGREEIYSLLRELRAAGYVHFKRQRAPGGLISTGIYFITEEPHSLHRASPEEVNPNQVRPDTVKLRP